MFTCHQENQKTMGLFGPREFAEIVVYYGGVRIGCAADPETVQADIDAINSVGLTDDDLRDYYAAATKAESVLGSRDLFPLLWDTHRALTAGAA